MRVIVNLCGAVVLAVACGTPVSPSTATPATSGATTNAALPAMYALFGSSVSVTVSGSQVVLKSNGEPDHTSPYWGAGNPLYESPQAGMIVNPNVITAQSLTIRVPASPAIASASDTPLGPIGMSINGVALFNQYAAGRSPLGAEIQTFDRYNGHPQQTGQYHYHLEPLWLTGQHGASSLIGVLLDGFPVYGPNETSGSLASGLDSCNGHTHATTEFPSGIYHYHVTSTAPYISGCFRGTPGSVG